MSDNPSPASGVAAEPKRTKEYVAGLLFAQNVLGNPVVALVHKKRPAWQAGRWNGIGGHIEAGETPFEAMEREFKEEAGASVSWWQHFATLEDPHCGEKDTAAWRVYWFSAIMHESLAEKVVTSGDEEVAWHPLDKLPDVIQNLNWLIPMALPGQSADWPYQVVERHGASLSQGPQQEQQGLNELVAQMRRDLPVYESGRDKSQPTCGPGQVEWFIRRAFSLGGASGRQPEQQGSVLSGERREPSAPIDLNKVEPFRRSGSCEKCADATFERTLTRSVLCGNCGNRRYIDYSVSLPAGTGEERNPLMCDKCRANGCCPHVTTPAPVSGEDQRLREAAQWLCDLWADPNVTEDLDDAIGDLRAALLSSRSALNERTELSATELHQQEIERRMARDRQLLARDFNLRDDGS